MSHPRQAGPVRRPRRPPKKPGQQLPAAGPALPESPFTPGPPHTHLGEGARIQRGGPPYPAHHRHRRPGKGDQPHHRNSAGPSGVVATATRGARVATIPWSHREKTRRPLAVRIREASRVEGTSFGPLLIGHIPKNGAGRFRTRRNRRPAGGEDFLGQTSIVTRSDPQGLEGRVVTLTPKK